MQKTMNLPTDVVSVLAFAFGAAVIIPSMISLLITLLAVLGIAG